MTILQVITAPDPVLRVKSSLVSSVDDKVRRLMDDMLETMYSQGGVGLAANQIGITQRVLVIDLQDSDDNADRESGFFPLYVANPEIISKSEELIIASEGCLSLGQERLEVARAKSISIKFTDYRNQIREVECDGWLSRAFQHEIDHLDGKLLIDYMEKVHKDAALRRLKKLKKHCL